MNESESYCGQFLLAVPDLLDPNFNQSVILLIHHDSQGASGLILNRVSSAKIGNLFEGAPKLANSDRLIYVGGPVEGPVMALHQCVSLAERDVLENVYFSMNRDNLFGIVSQSLRQFRLFSGYSGWGPGQLESEIQAGGWLLAPATAELVFAEQDEMWRMICDQVGLDIIFADHRAVQHDDDPTLN